MTSPVGRLYVLAVSLVTFFVLWAVVAAHPWAATTPDTRLAALQQREAQIARETAAAQTAYAARLAVYRAALAARAAVPATVVAATAPPVRVVTSVPVTTTRTS